MQRYICGLTKHDKVFSEEIFCNTARLCVKIYNAVTKFVSLKNFKHPTFFNKEYLCCEQIMSLEYNAQTLGWVHLVHKVTIVTKVCGGPPGCGGWTRVPGEKTTTGQILYGSALT